MPASPLRSGRLVGLLAVLAAGLSPGCAAHHEGDSVDTGAEAFTVEGGDKFVVSASPEEVVLLKKVGSARFPFDEAGLRGKALVVHPVAKRAETGVVARALSLEDDGDRWIVKTKPLTLGEMAALHEEEIVRVFVDRRKVRSPRGAVRPLSVADWLTPGRIEPQALSGFAFDGFDVDSGLELGKAVHVQTGVAFSHKITKSRFAPEALVEWSDEDGLELGFRADLEWESKLTLGGKATGELFRSRTIETPPVYVPVPIGVVPVPVVLKATATVTCNASVSGPLEVEIDLGASAKLGGSLRIKPSTSLSPSDWVSEGRWKAEADGSVSVALGAEPKLGAAVGCSLPRIELKATVGGVAGPYLAVTPAVSLGSDGAEFEGRVAGGVGAGMFGFGKGVEMNLYTWKPEL
jgi:hypothetical protein